ncbi:Zc3h12a-like Ribonuclease NYN domain-containing protein [Yoonia tamlensis]|uniref:Zc3h12a-like Ribonuclease NYN domain-containing protein n=1 Tax=Yoonia tamlensis TaxID=390270 RepID=A0A1I6GRK1_9RHOB|nr:hypothetical protein [Yoonia tamlensis]SFR44711.1 Zc3h12a-like Ribonuclease NYN domain-containing protein [Yoonia tamlensis]
MRLFRGLLVCTLFGLVICAVVLPEGGDKPRVIDALGKMVFATFAVLALGYLWRLRRWLARAPKPAQPRTRVGRPIVVDGSNVMHWGGDPSLVVVQRVIGALQERGYEPIVYFDANVGYKLSDRHIGGRDMAAHLGLPADDVTLAPSGTPADPLLLKHASDDGMRVVTNDRFLDWKQDFPKIGDKGFLVKGRWQQGSVILLGLGR